MTMAASRQASIDMYFDTRLWQLTAGLRMRMAGGIFLGLLALAAGIARYVFLGQLLARVFDAAPVKDWIAPAACAGAMVLLRALFDHLRTVQANRSSADVQQALRARLYDRIVALGPAWFANQRTGGVMLTVVDGVEQLQTFFGQYLPQGHRLLGRPDGTCVPGRRAVRAVRPDGRAHAGSPRQPGAHPVPE